MLAFDFNSDGSFESVGADLLKEAADVLSFSRIPVQDCLKYEFVLINKLNPTYSGTIKSNGVLIGLPAYFRVNSDSDLKRLSLPLLDNVPDTLRQSLLDTLHLSRDAKRYAIAHLCYTTSGYLPIFEKFCYLLGFLAFNGPIQMLFKFNMLSSFFVLVPLLVVLGAASTYLTFLGKNFVALHYSFDSLKLICGLRQIDLIEGGIEYCEKQLARNRLLAQLSPKFNLDRNGNKVNWFGLSETNLTRELDQLNTAKSRLQSYQKRYPDRVHLPSSAELETL